MRRVRFSESTVFSRMKNDQEAMAQRNGCEVRDAAGAAILLSLAA